MKPRVAGLATVGPRTERALVAFVHENAALLAITTAFAVLAYGYALTDPTPSLDEETAPTFAELGRANGWSVALYRWGLVAFQLTVLPGSSLPFLRLLLAVGLLSLTAVVYARILPATRSAQAFFAVVFVTVPTFAYAMTFSFMCVEFVLAILLFVLGLHCFVDVTRGPRVDARTLVPALVLWVAAPSFYQDYGVVLTAFLVYAFFRVAAGDGIGDVTRQTLWFGATLLVAVVVYGLLSFVIARAAGVGTGAYLVDYVAPKRTSAVLAQFVRRMRGFYFHPSIYGTDAVRLAALALPLLGASVRGSPGRRALLALLGVVIAIAPFAYGLGIVPPIRAASGLMFLAAGAAAFAVSRSGPSTALAVKLAVMWVALQGCVTINNMFRYESIAWEADRLVAADLARRIHDVAPDVHDSPAVRVVFAGSLRRSLSDALPGPDFWVGMFETWGQNKTLRRKRAMVLAGFPDFRLGSAADYEANRTLIDSMPAWPASGAVARQGDLVLVKLGPANGFAIQ